MGPKTCNTKIKSKPHPTSPAIGPKRIVPVFFFIKPRYTRDCLLCLIFSCFLSFLANERPSMVPPCAPHTNADETPSTLHTPHQAIRATTQVTAYTPPSRYVDSTYGYQFAPRPQTAVRQLHPKSRWARSILRCGSFARPPRSRQIHAFLVWRGVGCGGWRGLPVRRHSYRRHILVWWNYGGSMIG